jgi:osmotically-inducible protein OsmY
MSTRYNDRDDDREYDRGSRNYGRRSESDFDRSGWDYGRSSSDFSHGSDLGRTTERNYGRDYGRSSLESDYGRERESERYGREGGSGRGGREYGGGRSSSSRGGDYRSGGREGYWGGGWENERDERSRYGNPIGGSGFERGYNESSSTGYSSQRSNYPSRYRSGKRYGERGSEYDRERYGSGGEERGWWDRASDAVASWFGDEDAERRRRMDEQRAHRRGRGPKGYRRSDERIREDVNDRLGDDYYIDASDIEVMVSNTEVTLTGTVPSRNDKRRAEDIAESVSGVTNVENRLRVKQSHDMGSYYGASMSGGTGMGTSTDMSSGTSTGSSMGTGTGTGSSSSAGTGLESGTPGSTTSSAAAGGGSSTRGGRSTGD